MSEVAPYSSKRVAEAQVILQMNRMLGYIPIGTKDLLRILVHPDVLPLMESYLQLAKRDLIEDGDIK